MPKRAVPAPVVFLAPGVEYVPLDNDQRLPREFVAVFDVPGVGLVDVRVGSASERKAPASPDSPSTG
jgi:hypothetical protein